MEEGYKIGYARVSTGLQNLDLQEKSLREYGCYKIFTDKMSAAQKTRNGLESAFEFLRKGDTLVVWRLDRLGRSMEDLVSMMNELTERGVKFYSIQENLSIDNDNPVGKLTFHIFAAFAEFEKNLILERASAGRAAAQTRGITGGRPEVISNRDAKLIKTLVDGGVSKKEVARKWGVSRTTIYRYLNKFKESQSEEQAADHKIEA